MVHFASASVGFQISMERSGEYEMCVTPTYSDGVPCTGGTETAARLGMVRRPAFLIDIDCDLKTSAKQALIFTLEAGLLRPGTFVYYDDLSEFDYTEANRAAQRHQRPLYAELAQNAKLEEEVDNAADKMMLAAKKELELYSLFFNRIIENSNFDKARDDLVRFIEVESTAKYWGLAVKGFADFGL